KDVTLPPSDRAGPAPDPSRPRPARDAKHPGAGDRPGHDPDAVPVSRPHAVHGRKYHAPEASPPRRGQPGTVTPPTLSGGRGPASLTGNVGTDPGPWLRLWPAFCLAAVPGGGSPESLPPIACAALGRAPDVPTPPFELRRRDLRRRRPGSEV